MHAAAVLALLVLVLPPLAAALDANCPPASCGNLPIRYPFWLRGQQPSSCGYPSFGIDCDPARHAPPLLNDSYLRVLDIHYGNNSLVAFHSNLADDPTPGCRATKFNMSATIALSLLTISPANWELFLCGNCARRLPAEWLPMNCTGSGGGGAPWFLYLSHESGGVDQEIAAAGCQYSAVPVMPGSELRTPDDYGKLVRRGFLLEWKVPGDCAACEATGGGQCRFDAGENTFRCLCPDGSSQPATCARGELSLTDPMIP
ncbi:unnamed protein product [Urochloa humidicola]